MYYTKEFLAVIERLKTEPAGHKVEKNEDGTETCTCLLCDGLTTIFIKG